MSSLYFPLQFKITKIFVTSQKQTNKTKKHYYSLVSLELWFQVFEMQFISILSTKIPLQKSDLIPTK